MYTHSQCHKLTCAKDGETKVIRTWTAGDCDWQARVCLSCGRIIDTPAKNGCALPHEWASQRYHLDIVRPFIPFLQLRVLRGYCRGPERAAYHEILGKLVATIETMPKTYDTQGQGDNAVAHLHYFTGSCDWWITERDCEPEQLQAYGLADLGPGPEAGYIAITEIVDHPMIELDLYWTPKPLGQIRAERGNSLPDAKT